MAEAIPAPAGHGGAGPASDLEIRGPQLLLRYARPEDAAALYRLASDREVTQFFSWGPYTDESEAATYVRSLAPQARRGRAAGVPDRASTSTE